MNATYSALRQILLTDAFSYSKHKLHASKIIVVNNLFNLIMRLESHVQKNSLPLRHAKEILNSQQT